MKAQFPILVTEFGISTDVKEKQPLKASSPICVTDLSAKAQMWRLNSGIRFRSTDPRGWCWRQRSSVAWLAVNAGRKSMEARAAQFLKAFLATTLDVTVAATIEQFPLN